MPTYVAFIRGVNVGGHNIVRNEELKKAFNSLGYRNALVFKQSGNVLFETEDSDADLVKKKIEQKLYSRIGRKIAVFLRSLTYLEQLVKNDPFRNVKAENASLLVTFLSTETSESTQPLKIPNTTAEIILITKTEAYSITHEHGEGGKPNPFLEKKLKTQATTRNWNIIKEIVGACSK
jgi:uncharacterized protein (DUF1697 family)